MSVTLILEDGTGVVGSTNYEDEVETSLRLVNLAYTEFDSIAIEDTKKAFVFRATRTVDRVIKALAEDKQVFSWDRGLTVGQGLFYPRRKGDAPRVPVDIKLASAYMAEILALEASTDRAQAVSSLPTGVLQAELAEGVQMKFIGKRLDSRAVEDLRIEINLLLIGLVDLERKDIPIGVQVL